MSFDAVVRNNGDTATLDLNGEVDGLADEALNGAYDQAISGNPTRVVLNFANVSYINSTGIALIVGLLAEARRSNRTLAAGGLSDHYKEIFEITRISDFIEFIDQ